MVVAPGIMYRPTDVAAIPGQNAVYVVEQFNHRISKWEYDTGAGGDNVYIFTLDDTWGTNGDGTTGGPGRVTGDTDSSFYRPTGIAVDTVNVQLIVTDTFHNRVRIIDASDGAFIGSFGTGGTQVPEFYNPAGISLDTTQDNLIICDELNNRILKYDYNDGTPITPEVLGEPTPLSFYHPHGAGSDATGLKNIVSDVQRGVVNIYSNALPPIFETQAGQQGTETADELFFPGAGTKDVASPTSPVFFADTRNNTVKSINTTTGAIINQTGTAGGGNDQFYWPENTRAFTDTAIPYMVVADTYNNRIQVYDQTPTFKNSFGSP